MRTKRKGLEEIIFEGFDWSDKFIDGETISTSMWEVGSGLVGSAATYDDTSTEIKISEGTVGETYLVTNTIETSDDATYQKSLKVMVVNR